MNQNKDMFDLGPDGEIKTDKIQVYMDAVEYIKEIPQLLNLAYDGHVLVKSVV